MDTILQSLKKCILFKNKSLSEIENLLSRIDYKIKDYYENEIIFSSVQAAEKMGIILFGSVDVQKIFPTGKVVIIERKKSPELIAESSIFSRLDFYPDTISACKSCKILFIHKSQLQKLFSYDNDIMYSFLEYVSNSALTFRNKIGILSLDSIQQKISGFLIYDYKNNNSSTIRLPFSKKVWAEYLNVSRTSLSRELRDMQNKGIISFEKRIIKIHDYRRLENILSM